ncbi:uncharacterized protein BDW43DRAFT_221276 [Aspergillus alliaceus]|uniref:uncharacterized protein n=1 Tax=Petromyces alliaceus TaxID=209559 RepID=UPI0012A45AB4|nr:uncharacterized protein BDW43DRAFT_221276 [Aspergillus alliaceus]KAB8228161.1 hypothetical protein BDW43DRAFT_221276 [Aspergillus alliaceus]
MKNLISGDNHISRQIGTKSSVWRGSNHKIPSSDGNEVREFVPAVPTSVSSRSGHLFLTNFVLASILLPSTSYYPVFIDICLARNLYSQSPRHRPLILFRLLEPSSPSFHMSPNHRLRHVER